MKVELRVPAVGESITEVVISVWHKQAGDKVEQDETVAEIESDKATLELPAPAAGVLVEVLRPAGATAAVGEVIGMIDTDAAGSAKREAAAANKKQPAAPPKPPAEAAKPAGGPAKQDAAAAQEPADKAAVPAQEPAGRSAAEADGDNETRITPAARRALAESGLSASQVRASGPGGRLLKEDVAKAQRGVRVDGAAAGAPAVKPEAAPAKPADKVPPAVVRQPVVSMPGGGEEEVVPMSPIRRRIAERLMEAQHNAALLTTFNEIDMSVVIALRKAYQERFQQRYGVKLGFMSFFVKAAIEALKLVPQVNAEIRGADVIYKNYFDIGIAVGGGKGLVVPVLRSAHLLSFGEIELAIADFAARAQANKLDLEELKGGTFTISNGGVYGSLLSTPIVNPPQSGVLGLHAIQERAVVRDGQIVIRPMMYVALTYDHRLIDGRESVTFLGRVKETIEDPARVLLEI